MKENKKNCTQIRKLAEMEIPRSKPCPNKCPGYIGSMPGGENFSIDHNEEIKKKLFVENQIW